MRIALNRETKCRIQGSPYFWSRPPASPLLPFFEIFQTQNAWDVLCNQGGRQQPCFWGLLFWYDTNNSLLIYVDFLLSNVQISVSNPSWILRYCAKLLFDQDAANARIQGELQGKLHFLFFRPLFLSTSDRDLFTFTKGVKNYNSSVLLLLFRGGIRPARRHPRWCAQSISRRHRWQGHHPRCHQ